MAQPTTAPSGSWQSPITSDLIVAASVRLGQIELDDGAVYWVEGRPGEGGRNVLVRRTPDGQTSDATPAPFNVRSGVHEYGGGAFAVRDGIVYFSNWADQRIYRLTPGSDPEPLSPDVPGRALRFADFAVDTRRNRLLAVQEDHRAGGEPINTIVNLDLSGSQDGPDLLLCGSDFYASPRLSPDGQRLTWLTWHHPNMPWDGVELWCGDIAEDGTIGHAELVAGGPEESIFQPAWSPDGVLHFVSDRSGWWNLYAWQDGQVAPVLRREAETGVPQWVFGMSTYGFAGPDTIVGTLGEAGVWRLYRLNTRTGDLDFFNAPYTEIADPRVDDRQAVLRAGSATEPDSVVRLDLTSGKFSTLRRSNAIDVDPGYLSPAEPIEFPSEGGRAAYGLYYPPRNRDFTGQPGERPPLLVRSHGGPTSAASSALNPEIQFWTSRGFAVLDVNYGGSTGYGRAYRQLLRDRWGIVDVDDCVHGAQYLAERGLADPDRLAIRGGSAGGFTTLAALTFRDVFRAGASYYGIGDLEALSADTHKFESRYLDALIGPYPERRDVYQERSPIHHTDQLNCPVILFQGLEDNVVPPNQAEQMAAALAAKGLPYAYVPFDDEEHGFRRAETIKRSLDAELYFYSRIFGFTPADTIDPVPIENLPDPI